jgi:outer membrane immunogenic protein
LSGNWSLNSELLYLQFAKDDHSFRRGSNTFSIQTQDSAWVSRVGLNYRWDNARNAYASTQRAARPCGSARFSGGYVGGTIGAIQRTAVTRDTDGFIFDTADWTAVNANVAGGVQAGYDWQSCGKVLGVVADLNITNAGTQSQVYPNGGNGGDYQSFMRSSMDWFSTLLTRGGVVVGDMLVYITGGVALADFDTAISRESGQSTRSSGGTLWGWTGGAGAEVALAGNWSVNGEMLYMQFAKETDTFRSGNNFRTFEYHDSAWIGRVGVTYRFGATPASAN